MTRLCRELPFAEGAVGVRELEVGEPGGVAALEGNPQRKLRIGPEHFALQASLHASLERLL